MEKLRIVHVIYSFRIGGMERGIANIIRNASKDMEHIILCLSTSGETERLLPDKTPVIELHKAPGNSPRFLFKLARTLKSLHPAIVHTRNWGGVDAILASRLVGIRAVIQGEHGWVHDDPEGLNVKRLKVRRMLGRWVREYTCVSHHLEQWLLEVVQVKGKVTQIYNGVDTQEFTPGSGGAEIRKELGIPERAFVAGIVGRLVPIKNHAVLFQAFREFEKKRSDIYLLVVGDGPERERLEALKKDNVIFLGNRHDVSTILQALDVFVLSSQNEGISNTILEAMATELPVIATNVGGNPELVEDGVTGTLIPPNDPQAIASALLAYSTNPGVCKSHGAQGYLRVNESFSLQGMAQGYEAVYRRVASL